jgi:hypothetical protein
MAGAPGGRTVAAEMTVPIASCPMPKSATDTLQEIIFSAVVDAVVALKDASKGVPNLVLRDLNAIHANTAFADLPEPVRNAVAASVRSAFNQFKKEGYTIADANSVRPAGPRPGGPGAHSGGPRPPSGGAPRGPRPAPRRSRP